tara:strand:+ start:21 stop:956 length:936 start_codon:yes stop_codon:yes gene_type:complete
MIKKHLFVLLTLFLIILLKNTNIENFINLDVKISICSMVTKQPDFEFWLKYHLDYLKIDYIFLRIEDSPEYEELIRPYGDRVIASFHNKKDIDMKHNYLTIMDRQKENVNSSIDKAYSMGIDYLFHTDADELIYVGEENGLSKDVLLRKYLEGVSNDFTCIHFKNFEAVFPDNKDKCFNTNKFIDCKKGGCLSYANGKSVCRVKNHPRFKGPHYFTGKNYNIEDNKICVLHFDSCTYKQWETKFDLLKDTNEEKMKKIPFPFYKNSIRKLKKCGGEKKKTKSCNKELNDYYEEQKVSPYKKRVNLVDKNFN